MGGLQDELIKNRLAMSKLDSPLFMAALAFFKAGGGRTHAHEIIDRAYERLNSNDDARTNDDLRESAPIEVSNASSSQASGSDHSNDAQPRRHPTVPPARPALDLTGDLALGVKNVLAQSVFDRVKTNDGRAWGDVQAHELDSMTRDGALASRLRAYVGSLSNAQYSMKVRDLVSPEIFEQIRKQAHGS